MYINNLAYTRYICADVVEKSEADIEVYILTDDMSAVDLMKAFKACRMNPLKAYYCVVSEDKEFVQLATDAVKRGTLHVFTCVENLVESINGRYELVIDNVISRCLTESAEAWGVPVIDKETLVKVVRDTIDRQGVYAAVVTILRSLQSGRDLSVGLYANVLKSVVSIYASVESSVQMYRETGSQLLSVLASAKVYKTGLKDVSNYNDMVLHVMLKPISNGQDNLHERRDTVVRVAKENIL